MAATIQQNMGKTDRLVRGALGAALLLDGLIRLRHSPFRQLEALLGGAFLSYGLSGFDPLLSAYGSSTIPGRENNIWNLIKQAIPGQGIRPILTQDVSPQREAKPFNDQIPLAQALAVD